MRILQNHVEFIEFELIKKEIKLAEESKEKKFRFDDILVLFVSVEENDNEKIAEKAINEMNFLM